MKDTDHHTVHGSVHLCGERKSYERLHLNVGSRKFWTRRKTRAGLERPHFVAAETAAVAPAQPSASSRFAVAVSAFHAKE
jgi:hypothetical protein